MNHINKWIYKIKAPCSECPYKMGIITTFVNPCPECKLNGYNKFAHFQKHFMVVDLIEEKTTIDFS